MNKVEECSWREAINLIEGEKIMDRDPMTAAKNLETMENIRDNRAGIFLDESEEFYVQRDADGNTVLNDDGTPKQYARVTESLHGKIDMDALDPIQRIRLESGQNIGNHIDEIIRDYFEGELKTHEEYITDMDELYIEDSAVFDSFIKQLDDLSTLFESRNEKVIARNIVLHSEEHMIAGTVDLVTVNQDNGQVHIYDIKSKRSLSRDIIYLSVSECRSSGNREVKYLA